MSYTKIWVHAVWGTRGRQPLLSNGLRQAFLDHIMRNAIQKEIEINLINCWVDHVHCLIRLKADQNISDVIQLLKVEASHWINNNQLSARRFSWSREYYVASVSEGNLRNVRHYITRQEHHHANRTFQDEVEAFFAQYAYPQAESSDQDIV